MTTTIEGLTYVVEPTPEGVRLVINVDTSLAISIAEQALAMGEASSDPAQRAFYTEVAQKLNEAAIARLSSTQRG